MAAILLSTPARISPAKYSPYLSARHLFRQSVKVENLKISKVHKSNHYRLACRARLSPEKSEEKIGWELNSGSVSTEGNDATDALAGEDAADALVGEDAAAFDVGNQKALSWIYFSAILGVVLAILYVAWIDPSTGYGGAYLDAVSSFFSSHEVVMLILLFIFAVAHSGMASFRDAGERLMGERAYRVLFAGVSLPLAVSAVVYFINHRYDGVQLWQVQSIPGVHQLVWLLSFISFFFLYPSTFNLLEVAAVDKPKMHLWETGIIRISRHPQMVGQFIWCIAHTLWMGNSMMLTTSLGLVAHHIFGVWNGDRRMAARYGKSFEAVKNRTSIIPFAAILDGRQKLPNNYYKEFVRVPYMTILVLTLGAYLAHPLMQEASYRLHW